MKIGQPYPVGAVHQEGMAPTALFGLGEEARVAAVGPK
jgi:hypothetical protein